MAYATPAQVAAWLEVTATQADTDKWTRLAEVATRRIERECSRRFDQVTETRTFDCHMTLLRGEPFLIGDIVSASEVALLSIGSQTGFEPLAATDWELSGKRDEFPAYEVRFLNRPVRQGYRRVRIAGVWGWPAVPASITQAAIMLTSRLSLRDQSPQGTSFEGLAGLGEQFDASVGLDFDLMQLLDNYRNNTFGYPIGYSSG